MRRAHGFSLLEMVFAMGIMLAVTASVFALLNPAQGAFQAQPEVSDMQQRLRVGTDTLYKDLVMAGGGAYQGSMAGSLLYFFAPVMPYRNGSMADDPPGIYKSDTITLMYVPSTVAQTTLAAQGPALNSAEIGVTGNPGCPVGDPLCGFKEGMTLLMYDDSGNYDTFTVTNVQAGGQLHIQHNEDKLTYTGYNNTTKIVQAANIVYYLNATTNQLMFYDGSRNPDVPVVDNLVGLTFDYYGDPQPPLIKAQNGTKYITTYGPSPNPLAVGGWAAKENCIFAAAPTPSPKLAELGPANGELVKLTAAQLTDGPFCPNAASNMRFDADLLRVRKIAVTLRVQAALASLRGPAGVLFAKGGTSTGGSTYAPDQEVRFQVTPRNLNLGR